MFRTKTRYVWYERSRFKLTLTKFSMMQGIFSGRHAFSSFPATTSSKGRYKTDFCPVTIEADQCIVHCLLTAARRYRVPIDAEFLTWIKHSVACDLDQRCGICAQTYIYLLFYTQPPRLLPWQRKSHSNGSRPNNSSGYLHANTSWAYALTGKALPPQHTQFAFFIPTLENHHVWYKTFVSSQ